MLCIRSSASAANIGLRPRAIAEQETTRPGRFLQFWGDNSAQFAYDARPDLRSPMEPGALL